MVRISSLLPVFVYIWFDPDGFADPWFYLASYVYEPRAILVYNMVFFARMSVIADLLLVRLNSCFCALVNSY